MGKLKMCTTCGQDKPATTEFFYAAPLGRMFLSARCKECYKATNRERYVKAKQRMVEAQNDD